MNMTRKHFMQTVALASAGWRAAPLFGQAAAKTYRAALIGCSVMTGVGAVICAAAASSLVGRRRLAPALALGVACWALPLALMAITRSPAVAAVVATLIGAGVVAPVGISPGRTGW